MMSTLFFFLIALGILVFVHEFGHFIVAKQAGIRVERFSLGFPPKAFGFRWGETEYCISWIPFGGYVKVAGMADVGTETATGAPDEFPSKPVWVRMAVIAAGPAMNFLFAFVALAFLFQAYGIDTFPSTRIDVEESSIAAVAGLQSDDRIISLEGRPVDNAYELITALDRLAGREISIVAERNSRQLTLQLPPRPEEGYGFQLVQPTTVGRTVPGMPAEELGLQEGDRIIAVGDVPVDRWSTMSTEIRKHPDQPVRLVWERDGRRMEARITPAATTEAGETVGQIGIGPHIVRHDVGLFRAIALGADGVYSSSWLILDFLAQLFRGDRSTEELGGPLRIAQLAGETADQGLNQFVGFLAMLSVNLAIINLLPIPVLDGGHLVFLVVEGIRRRPLSLRQREVFQQIGLAILLFIMLLVTFNDLNQMVFHRIMEFFQ